MTFRSKIYRDIIVEGQRRVLLERQDYMEMFTDVLKLYGVVKSILEELNINGDTHMFWAMMHDSVNLQFDTVVKQQVDEVKKNSVRGPENERKFAPDMAIWVLRHYKLRDYLRIVTQADQILTFTEDEEPELVDLAKRIRALGAETYNKYVYKLVKVNSNFEKFILRNHESEEDIMKLDRELDEISKWIKNKLFGHFTGMVHVRDIQNFRFTNQWYSEVNTIFEAAERKWQEELDKVKNIIPLSMIHGDTIIMKFPDGKYWVNLNKPFCDLEGRAMGHCGNNQGRAGSGDRVLSLRENVKLPDGTVGAKPYLTFVLHSDGYLGETKARFNEKPGPEWHPYIMALLKLPEVKGIRGGGYAPDRNFFLKDLEKDHAAELKQHRPDYFPKGDDRGSMEEGHRRSRKPLG